MRTVGELVESISSWNPAREPESEFEYIDLGSVDNATKAIANTTRSMGASAPSRARQLVKTGDVLVSTVRPNLNAVAVVPPHLDGSTASTGFTVLRPGPKLDGRFLFHWVRSCSFIDDMVRKATGASYPAVSDRIVKESKIANLSVGEQRRIAAILDHADALRAKRRRMLEHLDSLAQSIFQDMFGLLPLEVDLLSVCMKITDGTHQSPGWVDEGIPFLFVSNIKSGEIDLDTQKFISENTWIDLTRRTRIELGDILYSTVGSYGVPAVVRTTERFAFQRHIAHIKPRPDLVHPDFLASHLASSRLKFQADRAAKGIAQPTVNLADIKKFKIVVPLMEQQKEFAARVDRVNQQRVKAKAALAADDTLFASLQARAFRGEL